MKEMEELEVNYLSKLNIKNPYEIRVRVNGKINLKSFGLSKSQSKLEEIEDIISEEGLKEEAFDAHEKLLLNILGLRAITAADIMVPRADIVAVDIDESSENIIKK